MKRLCIDIGATNTQIGSLEEELEDLKVVDTDTFLDDPTEILKEFFGPEEKVHVGIACPGPIDRKRGIIQPPNMPFEELDLKEHLDEDIDSIFLVNDCVSAVLGEYAKGHCAPNMVYVTISSGIGSGVIVDDKLIVKRGFAEVGHTYVGGERTCGCGGKGHWEAYCSGDNIPSYAEDLTGKKYVNAETLFERFYEGEKEAEKVIENIKEFNVRGFSNLIDSFGPDLIVIGGSVFLNNRKILLEDLEKKVERDTLGKLPKFKTTTLFGKAELYGLMFLWRSVKKDLEGLGDMQIYRSSVIDLK